MSSSLITLSGGWDRHHCGYCGDQNMNTYGIWAFRLQCKDYQALIDRGWRRSGKYIYKPDQKTSCCAQYTIRLNAKEFSMSRSHKKVLTQMRSYLGSTHRPTTRDKGPMCLDERMREIKDHPGFRTVLEPAEYSDEKYQLYKTYQRIIHKDPEDKISKKGFTRFLCDSPLIHEKVDHEGELTDLSPGYGSFHQNYYVQDKLVAVGVIDILPQCVSSVYLFYDPEYSHLSLGKFSALHEIDLVLTLSSIYPELRYYYMGFYIHTCQKMRYKAEYKPSDLLDPETYRWRPFAEVKSSLEDGKAPTEVTDPTRLSQETWPYGTLDPSSLPPFIWTSIPLYVHDPSELKDEMEGMNESLTEYWAVIGETLARRIRVII